MRIYLDTEFSQLTQEAKLLSLALVDSQGRSLYIECQDAQIPEDTWLIENVLCHMQWLGSDRLAFLDKSLTSASGQAQWQGFLPWCDIGPAVKQWLTQYQEAQVWADCVVWDWLLFCELFGGALNKPKQVYYLPFDLVTLLSVKEIGPDIDRTELRTRLLPDNDFSAQQVHHALDDAIQTRDIVEALLDG